MGIEYKNISECPNLHLPIETATRGIISGLKDEQWNCADENCPVKIVARSRMGMGRKSPVMFLNTQGCLSQIDVSKT